MQPSYTRKQSVRGNKSAPYVEMPDYLYPDTPLRGRRTGDAPETIAQCASMLAFTARTGHVVDYREEASGAMYTGYSDSEIIPLRGKLSQITKQK